jgi:hypothetical protein
MPKKIDRREFVKRAAYAAPAILTLKAMPAFAAAGSGRHKARDTGASQGESSRQFGGERSRGDFSENSDSRTRNRR